MTNAMPSVLDIANHASVQSDRWLFIASLLVLAIFAVFVGRWFLSKYDQLVQDHRAERERYTGSLEKIVSDADKTGRDLAVVIDRNTAALTAVQAEIKFCRENSRERAVA